MAEDRFRLPSEGRGMIRLLLRLDDADDALQLAIERIETAVGRISQHYDRTEAEDHRDLMRIHELVQTLTDALCGLSLDAWCELLTYHGHFTEIFNALDRLQKCAGYAMNHYRPTANLDGMERLDAVGGLVGPLVLVFDEHYTGRRKGPGSRYRADTIEFVTYCLKQAGVPNIPGSERLYRDYIQKQRASTRRLNETIRLMAIDRQDGLEALRKRLGRIDKQVTAARVSGRKRDIERSIKTVNDCWTDLGNIESLASSTHVIDDLRNQLDSATEKIRSKLERARRALERSRQGNKNSA